MIPPELLTVPDPPTEALIASRRWALAKLGPLPARWSPKVPTGHSSAAIPNLLRLVADAAPVAIDVIDQRLKQSAEQAKALKAEKAQLKQLATVAQGGA